MNRQELTKFLETIGLNRNLNNLAWRLDIRNRVEISEEMFLFSHGDEKRILIEFLRNQRRSLDRFIADMEEKVIEYEQE